MKHFPKVEGFEIVDLIGCGHFGTVYKAISLKYKQIFALKIIPKSDLLNAKAIERIKREASVLQKVNHPNVLQIFDFVEEEREFVIVFEYCQYGTLMKLVKENGKLEKPAIQFLFQKIFEGLNQAHQQYICHRDLKLENILLDSYGRPKIGDWGESRESAKHHLLTSIHGTRVYMAPELWENQHYRGPAADMWAMGVMLYICAVGSYPWKATSEMAMYEIIRSVNYSIPDFVDEEIADVIKELLKKDPKSRSTAEEVLNAPLFNNCPVNNPYFSIRKKLCAHASVLSMVLNNPQIVSPNNLENVPKLKSFNPLSKIGSSTSNLAQFPANMAAKGSTRIVILPQRRRVHSNSFC